MRKFLFVSFALLALVSMSGLASAQTPQATVFRGQGFNVLGDHDGVDTTSYRLYVNGTMTQELPVTALAAGVIAFQLPAGLPTKGMYTLTVGAVGEGGEVISDPFLLEVKARPPRKVTGLRVVVIIP